MSIFTKNRNKIAYFNSNEGHSAYEMGLMLFELLHEHVSLNRVIVFLCIGSDRATGDCLGPIIGYKLSKIALSNNIHIYGTLEHPVHAKNLKETMNLIYQTHDNAFIVAIDASLGKSNHVGYITLGECPLKPGAGVDKDLPEVGDISITGIVNFSGFLDHMLLQTTRLNIVMSLADTICQAIHFSMTKIKTYTLQTIV